MKSDLFPTLPQPHAVLESYWTNNAVIYYLIKSLAFKVNGDRRKVEQKLEQIKTDHKFSQPPPQQTICKINTPDADQVKALSRSLLVGCAELAELELSLIVVSQTGVDAEDSFARFMGSFRIDPAFVEHQHERERIQFINSLGGVVIETLTMTLPPEGKRASQIHEKAWRLDWLLSGPECFELMDENFVKDLWGMQHRSFWASRLCMHVGRLPKGADVEAAPIRGGFCLHTASLERPSLTDDLVPMNFESWAQYQF